MLLRILAEMEVWVLLFAAGSGYLARCWTKSSRMKDDFSNTSNDIDSVQPFSRSVSPIRREFGKRRDRRPNTNHIGKVTDSTIKEMNVGEDFLLLDYENVSEETMQPCQSKESFDGCFQPVNNLSFSQVEDMTSSEENELQWGGECKLLTQRPVLIQPNKCKVDDTIIGKRIPGSCAFDGADVPGFSDVPECMIDQVSENSIIQKRSNRRYQNIPSKWKVEQKFRNRKIASQNKYDEAMKGNTFQMAQSDEKLKSETDKPQHASIRWKQTDFEALKMSSTCHCLNLGGIQIPKKPDMFYGLTSLPRKPTSQKLGKIKRIKDSLSYSEPHVRQGSDKEGTSENLLKCLLFNIGVSIGMMSTITSNRREVEHSIRLLKDAEWLLEDIEYMLDGRNTEDYADNHRKDSFRSLTEPNVSLQIVFSNLRSAKDVLNHVSCRLCQSLQPDSVTGYSREMSTLEAELESELERMELDMNGSFISKRCPKFPAWNEFDLSAGDLALGELPISNIFCGDKVDEREEDCSCCCSEDAAFGYSGVSPMELASRLHEVIEARQEKRIQDLETELMCMRRMLQAKDYELHIWKKDIVGDCCSSSQQDSNHKDGGNEFLSERAIEKHISSPIFSYFPDLSNSNRYIAMEGEDLAVNHDVGDESSETLSGDTKVFNINADGFAENMGLHGKNKGGILVCDDKLHDGAPEVQEISSFNDSNATRLSDQSNKSHFRSTRIGDVSTCDNFDLTDEVPTQSFVQKGEAANYCLDPEQMLGDKIANLHGKSFHQGHDPYEISNFDWSYSSYEAIVESPEKFAVNGSQDIIADEYGDLNTSQESSSLSDLDEQLSRSLIERILEKRRKGSSIIKVAKSMLASFETDQSLFSTD